MRYFLSTGRGCWDVECVFITHYAHSRFRQLVTLSAPSRRPASQISRQIWKLSNYRSQTRNFTIQMGWNGRLWHNGYICEALLDNIKRLDSTDFIVFHQHDNYLIKFHGAVQVWICDPPRMIPSCMLRYSGITDGNRPLSHLSWTISQM
jgi:hypothetical protein